MEEIIEKLQTQAGLSLAQATQATAIFVAYVKSKLPSALHGTVDSVLNSKGTVADSAKEKLRQFSTEVEEVAKEFGGKVTDFLSKKKEP